MSEPIKPAFQITREKRQPTKPGRVDLIPQEFDNLVEDQGSFVRITPSMLCPNRTDLADTNHTLDCPVCFGEETVDLDDECTEEWVFIQGVKLNKELQVQGIFDIKDATMTCKANTRINYWYKIEILDFASIFNQLLKRGNGSSDKLRYLAAKACDTPFYCVDNAGNKYKNGVDFRTVGRDLTWLTANRPGPGKLYSLIYPIVPTFRVLELLHDNRYYYNGFKSPTKSPVNLPQQSHLRWDYIANKSGHLIERIQP